MRIIERQVSVGIGAKLPNQLRLNGNAIDADGVKTSVKLAWTCSDGPNGKLIHLG